MNLLKSLTITSAFVLSAATLSGCTAGDVIDVATGTRLSTPKVAAPGNSISGNWYSDGFGGYMIIEAAEEGSYISSADVSAVNGRISGFRDYPAMRRDGHLYVTRDGDVVSFLYKRSNDTVVRTRKGGQRTYYRISEEDMRAAQAKYR